MMDNTSNAIASLDFLLKQHQIKIDVKATSVFSNTWFLIEFKIDELTFMIQVDDEFDDLSKEIPALSLCVVLRSLEEYKEATDFLDWCKKTGLASSNNALEYFRTLAQILVDTENRIEEIDSKISDIEFTTNAGAAQELRTSRT